MKLSIVHNSNRNLSLLVATFYGQRYSLYISTYSHLQGTIREFSGTLNKIDLNKCFDL